MEKPTDTEKPVDTEKPADTEEPTDTEKPADTEEPADTEGTLPEEVLTLSDPVHIREEESWTVQVTEDEDAPEIPEETCTVDYSKQQSESVTYDGYKEDGGIYKFYYTIHEGAGKDLVIDLAQCALAMWEDDSQMPGDHYQFQILIQNESGNDYRYRDNSFVLAPGDATDVGNLEDGSALPVLTYDGQYLPIHFSSAMIPYYFYEDVFGVSSSAKVTFDMMCRIYDYLEKDGYSGETAITDYLLDYFNHQKGVDYENLTDFFADHPDWLAEPKGTFNGIYTMTAEQLDQYVERYPWIDRFLYVQKSGSKLSVQIKWPEPEIAAVSYNSFYMGLFSVVYGQENVENLNPNGSGVEFSRSHGVGDYMEGTPLYQETNAYFQDLTKDGFKSGDELEIWSGYGIDGPGMGNSYQNYSFTYYNIIELEQTNTTYTVRHEYYTNDSLTGSVTTDLAGNVITEGVEGTVDQEITSASAVHLTTYDGNDYTFTSVTPADKLVLVKDEASNVIVLRYDRTTGGGGGTTDPGDDDDDDDDDDDRPSNPGTDIPDEDTPTTDLPGTVIPGDTPSTDIPDEDTPTTDIPEEDTPMAEVPKTGDLSALWLALTGLSGSGLAAVTVLGRKKRDEE